MRNSPANGCWKSIEAARDKTAAEIVHAIGEAVADHRNGAAPNDDTTIVALSVSRTVVARV